MRFMSRRIRTGTLLAGGAAVILAAPLAVSQVPASSPPAAAPPADDRCADLRAQVKELRDQVSRLEQQLAAAPRAGHTVVANRPGTPAITGASQRAFPPLCSPPTYVDAGGIRRVLPECMDYLMLDRGPSADRDAKSTSDRLLLDRGPSARGVSGNRGGEDLMDYRGPSTSTGSSVPGASPCGNPVYVDAQGIRHYKSECF